MKYSCLHYFGFVFKIGGIENWPGRFKMAAQEKNKRHSVFIFKIAHAACFVLFKVNK